MCRVEPVKQLLVAAAALAVVQRHADNGKNAEPLIVDCEHLGKGEIRQTANLQKDQNKITQEGHGCPNGQPQALVVIQCAYSAMPPARKDQPPSVMDVHKGSGAVMTHANTEEPIGAS